MNYPAASSRVSSKALNAPRGGEYNPCPPQAGLSASGGFNQLAVLIFYVRKKLEVALKAVQEEPVVPHEEVKKRFSSW